MYIGGNEHAVLHLLYSRFITMVLKDLGHIDFEEPFERFRAHGLIVKDGAKMSKSRGNVVVPDEYIEEYGADTFRTYLMFIGPYQEGGDFREAGITGPYHFLNRLWDTALSADDRPLDAGVEQKLHATIKKVTEALEALSYNTAIAAMMEYLNVLRAGGRTPERAARGAAGDPAGPLRAAPGRGALAPDRARSGSIFDSGELARTSTPPRRWRTRWSSWCR